MKKIFNFILNKIIFLLKYFESKLIIMAFENEVKDCIDESKIKYPNLASADVKIGEVKDDKNGTGKIFVKIEFKGMSSTNIVYDIDLELEFAINANNGFVQVGDIYNTVKISKISNLDRQQFFSELDSLTGKLSNELSPIVKDAFFR